MWLSNHKGCILIINKKIKKYTWYIFQSEVQHCVLLHASSSWFSLFQSSSGWNITVVIRIIITIILIYKSKMLPNCAALQTRTVNLKIFTIKIFIRKKVIFYNTTAITKITQEQHHWNSFFPPIYFPTYVWYNSDSQTESTNLCFNLILCRTYK